MMNLNRKSHFVDHWEAQIAILGFLSFLVLIFLNTTTHWVWSVLMDEIGFLQWMPKIHSLWRAFQKEVVDYWNQGRFYPVKYLMNLVKWRYLPLDPNAFHWVNFVLLTITIVISTRIFKIKNYWLAFAIAILNRPLLDVLALSTIAEGWVILSLSIGLLQFVRNRPSYRFWFIIAALSKEPAIVTFLSSSLYFLFSPLRQDRNKFAGFLDGAFFLILLVFMWFVKQQGTYLDSYRLGSINQAIQFFICCVKVGIGTLPFLILLNRSTLTTLFSNRSESRALFFSVFFGAFYTLLVSGKSSSGYLLIPISYCIFVAGMTVLSGALQTQTVRHVQKHGFLALMCLISISSLTRYALFASAHNHASAVLTQLVSTDSPNLIIVSAEEASSLTGSLVGLKRSKSEVIFMDDYIKSPFEVPSELPVYFVDLFGISGKLPEDKKQVLDRHLGPLTLNSRISSQTFFSVYQR